MQNCNITLADVNEQVYAAEMHPSLTTIVDQVKQTIAMNIVCNRYSVYEMPQVATQVKAEHALQHVFPAFLAQQEKTLLKGMVGSEHAFLVERLLEYPSAEDLKKL